MPTYQVSLKPESMSARVNVCQASKPNSMSANVVNVIFNQESVYANLSCPKWSQCLSSSPSQCLPSKQPKPNVWQYSQCHLQPKVSVCQPIVSKVESRSFVKLRSMSAKHATQTQCLNVCQASNPNPMTSNVVHVIFNQESMYANLSCVPQTRVNVCQASKPNSMSANSQCHPQPRVSVCQPIVSKVEFNQESMWVLVCQASKPNYVCQYSLSSSTKSLCMPSRVNVFRQARVNVCQASNPMSANLSRVRARSQCLPSKQPRVNVCQASKPNSMSPK